jgi:hypothetical protein
MLHAWRMRLRHPRTGAEMSFETPPPADFEHFWASLTSPLAGEVGSSPARSPGGVDQSPPRSPGRVDESPPRSPGRSAPAAKRQGPGGGERL